MSRNKTKMLIIKNISKILAVAVIFVGFLAGSFVPAMQPSSCCGTDDNSCCCISDEEAESNNQTNTGYNKRCGCGITESPPHVTSELSGQLSTKTENKIDITDSQTQTRELFYSYRSQNSIRIESIRNSGPPIYLASCSLLI
ncbi:MAG: hypothetical protein GY865_03560 [candidate division Zixibacteria bacterium]|nr:hypothetical protein [candidate division Zixibacteria bacterium]